MCICIFVLASNKFSKNFLMSLKKVLYSMRWITEYFNQRKVEISVVSSLLLQTSDSFMLCVSGYPKAATFQVSFWASVGIESPLIKSLYIS